MKAFLWYKIKCLKKNFHCMAFGWIAYQTYDLWGWSIYITYQWEPNICMYWVSLCYRNKQSLNIMKTKRMRNKMKVKIDQLVHILLRAYKAPEMPYVKCHFHDYVHFSFAFFFSHFLNVVFFTPFSFLDEIPSICCVTLLFFFPVLTQFHF